MRIRAMQSRLRRSSGPDQVAIERIDELSHAPRHCNPDAPLPTRNGDEADLTCNLPSDQALRERRAVLSPSDSAWKIDQPCILPMPLRRVGILLTFTASAASGVALARFVRFSDSE